MKTPPHYGHAAEIVDRITRHVIKCAEREFDNPYLCAEYIAYVLTLAAHKWQYRHYFNAYAVIAESEDYER